LPPSSGQYSFTLKKETGGFSETLVPMHQTESVVPQQAAILCTLLCRHAYNKLNELTAYFSLRFNVLPPDRSFRCWHFCTWFESSSDVNKIY
jgi:hypothetical protein